MFQEKQPTDLHPTIVIPAFRRPHSLARLLTSLDAAEVPFGTRLVLSLEGGASCEVAQVAKAYRSEMFQISLVQHESRLGLRDHILWCGGLAIQDGAVVVLEDDLVVDKYFYYVALEGLATYRSAATVAGIGLYAYEYNEFANLPFTPMSNGYSAYPIMVPCSWGQCWSKPQWELFTSWLSGKTDDYIGQCALIPDVVRRWPKTSWKKYFAAYLAEARRYFINPYSSYTTNFADSGTHLDQSTSIFQVSLSCPSRPRPELRFPPVDFPEIAYDAYMEACGAAAFRAIGMTEEDVEIDLYGSKGSRYPGKMYMVSPRRCGPILKRFPASLRPLDANIVFQNFLTPEEEHFLYLCKRSSDTGDGLGKVYNVPYFVRFRVFNLRFLTSFVAALLRKLFRRLRQHR
jgi:hypothetical protein